MVPERRWLVILCLFALLALVVSFGRPPSSVRAQAACAELISDGGFETGEAWQLSASPVAPDYITYQKHDGDRALRLGIDDSQNVMGSSSARQTITIPGSANDVTLSFWSYTFFTGPPGADSVELDLLAPDGYTVLERLWSADNDSRVWSESTIDLTRWRGNTVQIYFTVFNDGQGSTAGMYLDDVSVQACPADGTPLSGATPTPSATPSQTPVYNVASPTATQIPVADTASPSAPSAPAVPPAGCVDLLQDGGFEQMAAGWVPGRDPVPVQIAGTPVHSGSYSLKLGEDAGNVLSYSSARQAVAIPAGYGQALLDFWTWTWADDTGGTDHQEADFLSAGGLVLQKFWRVTANDRAWVQHIIPVTSYAGQTVQVYFNAYNDGSGSRAGMYLDDVHLWVCPNQVFQPAGQPNATPLPPAAMPTPPAATVTPVAGGPVEPGATGTITQAGPAVTVIVLGNGQPTTVAQAGSTATPTAESTATPVVAYLAPTAAAPVPAPGIAPVLTETPAAPASPAGPLAGDASWLTANWPKPWWMPLAVIAALIVVLILLRAILLGSASPP